MNEKIGDNIHTESTCGDNIVNAPELGELKGELSENSNNLLFHVCKHTGVVPSKDIKWYRVKYKRKEDL